MAIDEMRIVFPVAKWDKRQQSEQVWFAGAHADVGGGYKESKRRFSDVALQWMLSKLGVVGVTLATPLTYVPDRGCCNQSIHKPWESPPFRQTDEEGAPAGCR